jgi:hypothetical protein
MTGLRPPGERRSDGPRTEAGRRLLTDLTDLDTTRAAPTGDYLGPTGVLRAILAIEAKAAIAAAENHVCEVAAGPPDVFILTRVIEQLGESDQIWLGRPYSDFAEAIVRSWPEAAAGPRYPGAPGGVHDHGPHQGPGITCPEYLIGHCRLDVEQRSVTLRDADPLEAEGMEDWIGSEAEAAAGPRDDPDGWIDEEVRAHRREKRLREALTSGNYLQVYDHRQSRWLSPEEAVAVVAALAASDDVPGRSSQ